MAARGGVFLPLLLLLVGVSAVAAKPKEFEKNDEVEVLNITKLGKLIETRKWLDEGEVEVFDDVDLVAGETVEEGNRQYWSPNCPSGFYKYWSASNVASICYTIGTSKKDWFAAKEACERLTPPSSRCFSTLASVMNGNENHFISTLMDAEGIRDHVWIGLNDRTYEGYFDWLDGRQYGFSYFYSGEPNNGGVSVSSSQPGEDCVELMYGYGGRWNDRSCTDEKYYACKAFCV